MGEQNAKDSNAAASEKKKKTKILTAEKERAFKTTKTGKALKAYHAALAEEQKAKAAESFAKKETAQEEKRAKSAHNVREKKRKADAQKMEINAKALQGAATHAEAQAKKKTSLEREAEVAVKTPPKTAEKQQKHISAKEQRKKAQQKVV